MNVVINGKEQILDKQEISVKELLSLNNVEMPDMVSVQLNGEFVKRENFENTNIKENDKIDFLYFMGGGSLLNPGGKYGKPEIHHKITA